MPVLPNVDNWASHFLQIKFEEEPTPEGTMADDLSAVLCRIATDVPDAPPNFASYGYFNRVDPGAGPGESIGDEGEQCNYEFVRPYIWDNRGHLAAEQKGSKFDFKDRYMLLEFPSDTAVPETDMDGVIQDSEMAVRFSFLSGRMRMGKARARALRPDLKDAMEDIGKLDVSVGPPKEREKRRMQRRLEPLLNPDCGEQSDGSDGSDSDPDHSDDEAESAAPAPQESPDFDMGPEPTPSPEEFQPASAGVNGVPPSPLIQETTQASPGVAGSPDDVEDEEFLMDD